MTSLSSPEAETGAWPRQDLLRRLLLALRIAGRTLRYLGEQGHAAAGQEGFGPDKPLAETAMLLYVARKVPDAPDVATEIAALAQQLECLARTERTLCDVALHPTISLQLAMPHLLLRELGRPDERFDRVLDLSLNSQARSGREVLPHRTLEAVWLCRLWHGTERASEADLRRAAADASVLNHPLDLVCGERDDAYALTHCFMYLTGFGDLQPSFPRPLPVILAEVEGALARSLLDGDYDLAAELLMSWPLTGSPWTPAAIFGLRVLTSLEDEIGVLPAWNGVPAHFEEKRGEERTRYALAANYHTALVMGMLAALSLRPSRAPCATISGPSVSSTLLGTVLDATGARHSPWQSVFNRLDAVAQAALGAFVLDMALLAAVRRNDFKGVAGLLALGSTAGLAATPLAAQTTQLLHRIALAASVSQFQPHGTAQATVSDPPLG
jgi:hypothetical protein